MRYLTIGEIVFLHRSILERTGGLAGVRDLGALESAAAQPRATFGGVDLHLSVVEKAAALCFSIVRNHPFLDGNKRVGHAAMETFLVLNGFEVEALIDHQERMILDVAAARVDRSQRACQSGDPALGGGRDWQGRRNRVRIGSARDSLTGGSPVFTGHRSRRPHCCSRASLRPRAPT